MCDEITPVNLEVSSMAFFSSVFHLDISKQIPGGSLKNSAWIARLLRKTSFSVFLCCDRLNVERFVCLLGRLRERDHSLMNLHLTPGFIVLIYVRFCQIMNTGDDSEILNNHLLSIRTPMEKPG